MDTNHPQTNHFWPSFLFPFFFRNKKGRVIFVTCFRRLLSPSRFRHHTNNVPIPGHHSFSLTYSHFFNLLLTANVPSSCHPARFCLPSTLPSIHRIITKLFYQTFHIHLGPSHIFHGVVLRALCSFRSVKLFFSSCLPQAYFFCPQKTTRHEMTIAASVPIIQVSHISPSI